MNLSTHEKLLVTQTFYQIMAISDRASQNFYNRLFEIAPEAKPMFDESNMIEMRKKFIDMIATVVYSLDSIDHIKQAIRRLGERHKEYGVSKVDYDKVREAFMWMLKTELRTEFTPDVEQAWQTVYDWIFTTATEGLYD